MRILGSNLKSRWFSISVIKNRSITHFRLGNATLGPGLHRMRIGGSGHKRESRCGRNSNRDGMGSGGDGVDREVEGGLEIGEGTNCLIRSEIVVGKGLETDEVET